MRPVPLIPGHLYKFVLAAILLEIAWYILVVRRTYPWRDMAASFGVLALRLPAKLLLAAIVAPVAALAWPHRLFTIPLNTAWGLALLFLGEEFAYYWSHRMGHRVRWAWATHAVHHTPTQLHLASAFRLGLTEPLSGAWIVYVPLFLLGLNPVAVFATLGVNLFYQFWLHTDLIGRLGPIEWIFNTPTHHRVHHASNDAYIDRNYGGILIIFDRMFATFADLRPSDPPRYGLTGRAPTYNPLTLAFREWIDLFRDVAAARGLRSRLAQAFGPPGAHPSPVQNRTLIQS